MNIQTIKVLIVDDEPLAREIMTTYIMKIPGLEIVGDCKNALQAFSVLSKQQVDIMLLDINMPEINGIEFLKTIKDPPCIIFTTAYSEFAVESYEYNAVDYLLKPISFERFLKAINKTVELIQPLDTETSSQSTIQTTGNENIIFVKSDGKWIKVDISKVWFIEALKDYLRLWTDSGKIIIHSTMKNFEEQFAQIPFFIRVHKSYIINMNYISEIDGNTIRIKDQAITIGNTYKEEISKIFNGYKLL